MLVGRAENTVVVKVVDRNNRSYTNYIFKKKKAYARNVFVNIPSDHNMAVFMDTLCSVYTETNV